MLTVSAMTVTTLAASGDEAPEATAGELCRGRRTARWQIRNSIRKEKRDMSGKWRQRPKLVGRERRLRRSYSLRRGLHRPGQRSYLCLSRTSNKRAAPVSHHVDRPRSRFNPHSNLSRAECKGPR